MFDWNDVRHFLAVARSGSTLTASRKLKVSQPTVARRIAMLEEALGLTLFERRQQGYRLTQVGEALLPAAEAIEDGATALADAAAARSGKLEGVVRLTSNEMAGAQINPLMSALRDAYPGIRVDLIATEGDADLLAGEADVAIRFGLGRYPGLHVEPLMAEWILPVASPVWKRRQGRIGAAHELDGATLVHDAPTERDGSGCGWTDWFRHFGVGGVDCEAGPRFNQADLALDATCNGLGVAMGRWSLVADDLAARRLVRVPPLALFGR